MSFAGGRILKYAFAGFIMNDIIRIVKMPKIFALFRYDTGNMNSHYTPNLINASN